MLIKSAKQTKPTDQATSDQMTLPLNYLPYSKQHLAREDASHVFLGTNQPSLNTYFSWRALYSDDTFDSSRHKRRTSTRPGEDNQDVTQ